jgi:hypothetical protein
VWKLETVRKEQDLTIPEVEDVVVERGRYASSVKGGDGEQTPPGIESAEATRS